MVDPRTFSDAVWSGDLHAVDALIAAGADVNLADDPRMSPLRLAIEQVSLDIIRRLISAGADVNAKSEDGWTPLTHAIDIESDSASQLGIKPSAMTTQLTDLLLNAGAVPTVEAFELARRYGNYKAESAMERYAGGSKT